MYASILTALALLTASTTSALPTSTKRATGVQIKVGDSCLVINGPLSNGTPLSTVVCSQAQTTNPNDRYYSLFDISAGDQASVKLTGTNYCLDAGENPGPNSAYPKIWTCYPGLPQQRWYYTDDLHIAITGGDTCLSSGRYGVTTESCGGNSLAYTQAWTASAPGNTGGSTTTTTAPPPPTSTLKGQQIFWNGDKTKCLTASPNGYAAIGSTLAIVSCLGENDPGRVIQNWLINRGAGAITLAAQNYCIDAGLQPGDGVDGKIWTCYDNVPQQNWYYTDDNHIALTGGSVCLSVIDGFTQSPTKPYGSYGGVQQLQCDGASAKQLFTLS